MVPGARYTGVVIWDEGTPIAHGSISPYPVSSWAARRALRVAYRHAGDTKVTRFTSGSPVVAFKPFAHDVTVAVVSEWRPRSRDKDRVRVEPARYWALTSEVLGVMDGALQASGVPTTRVYEDIWRKLIYIRTGLKFPSGAARRSSREREYFFESVRRQWPSITPGYQAECRSLWAGQWSFERGFAPRLG